jgi:hypothetical protein
MTDAEKATQREYRRIRKMVVSMRIHALGKAAMARRQISTAGTIAFYQGQEDAMAQLLIAMVPQQKRAATKPRKRSER